ncbi:hypothetical protein [Aquibacillus sediminis]|uniref:hypothetical protein n=1 Tax=Aquibacillus sediminis TaxID=2574734 RepID=UPI001108CB33|nr:hypothetical protein [Aquibacillus sediminis]
MTQQYLTVEEFNDLLQQWIGNQIVISKQEIKDLDQTFMKLDSISYSKDTRRMDDYEPMHSLLLHGTGQIETESIQNQTQALPSDYYEIPLEDSTLYHYNNQRFSLITDRGTYTIEIAPDQTT